MGKFKKETIIICVLCLIVLGGGYYIYDKRAGEQKVKMEEQKQQELGQAFNLGVKRIYDLSDNCQVAVINSATTTRQLIDAKCVEEQMNILKEAGNNCPSCPDCEVCENN